ncbi:MAG TPA: YebC/PmpR family DNA-binding transcriptional regulator [Candidatus Paceibacterota bacterium]|nr:YebC/PmpR family DNA-binding transcriptional regulator [Candidatus Paceibacterota bacterium]HMP18981.1 YebC/PmpR family DNA-binding transcriptional regulator [Candidatus Paceibacterota bacterium]HMP85244.1 YebC/PmpR family DNA-binding transcriptional regulator [Candidatus Paceibacterota bacterium]
MSGHNKWSKIKNKKGVEDAKRSQKFSKLSKLITSVSKRVDGNTTSPELVAIVEIAKKENMPKDTIERAIKKGTDSNTTSMESVLYETYGPGGTAIMIEGLTDNKNRTAAEIRHILSKNGFDLAQPGSASWAFSKENGKWIANTLVDLSDEDLEKLSNLVDILEELEDVQEVFTNAE